MFLLHLNHGSSSASGFHNPQQGLCPDRATCKQVYRFAPHPPLPPTCLPFSSSNPFDWSGWPRIKKTSTLPYGHAVPRCRKEHQPALTLIDVSHMLASRLMDIWNLAATPTVVFQFQVPKSQHQWCSILKRKEKKKHIQTYAFQMCTHDKAKIELPKWAELNKKKNKKKQLESEFIHS